MLKDDSLKPDTTRLINPEELLDLQEVEGEHRRASLVVLVGWEMGREIEIGEAEQILGRSPTAHVTIGEQSISRQHARIVRCGEGEDEYFEIADLGSSNGTRVNNVPVKTARLADGDKIQMGDVVFKFVIQDPMDAQFYKEVHRRIHYDQLTGLMTLEAFRRYLEGEMRESKDGGCFTVAMTDLDGLKRVNDTHGHLAGRMAVREMGSMIRQVLRPQDRAALYGGDETIILYPKSTLDAAREVAERLRSVVAAREFEHAGQTFRVTISQGLAEWPRDGKTVEQIIAAADRALYAAKAAGRNCVKAAGE